MVPRKIRSFMLATVAIVVPSLNVLLIMTELPAFTGTSKINPSIVDRIRVLLNEALQNMEFDAQLEYISPKGVEENGANQFEIKAAITVPDSITIRSGYSANAEIVLARASKVLAVPESTFYFKNDSTFVYVLTDSVPSQKFSRRAVITGMSDGIQIEIKNGLNVNEKVRGAEKK